MAERRNILVIISDQLSQQALPAYGNSYAKTPNIDRIARQGVRFANCYTPCPLCQPTRASFWTGLYPHETGILSNGRKHHVPPLPASIPTLGRIFAKAGYETVHFGKTHDAGSLRGFRIESVKDVTCKAETAWPLNYDTWQDRDTAVKVVDYLKGAPKQPFLAVADFNNPHNICGWVGENQGTHEDVPVPGKLPPLPANFRDTDLEKRPVPVQYICCSHRRLAQASVWSESNYRHYLAAYYHYLSRVDAEIGLVLEALAARPDAADTLIVFMADHGDGMAGHGMVTKQVSFYEETTRVPLMFAGPGVQGRGKTLKIPLVSLLDLLPTLCDYAGLKAPRDVRGASLTPWLRGVPEELSPHEYVASEWHTEWGFTISPGRMLRTPRYKYVRYLEGDGEEFYDLRKDPGETRTLIDVPKHAAALEGHRALLQTHLEQTGDPFFSLAWEADPRWRSHQPGYHNHRGPAAPMVDAE